MESFYGGRPGASFIIAKTFPSVVDMVQAFGGGSGYNEVYYDEYVMIQSNVTDNDNGKIYRRGYDLNNGLNGAEFIGSICGPAGPASYLELYPYSAIKPKNSADASTNPVYGLIEEQCDKLLTGTYPDINAFELIPGKETENGTDIYNNNIIYKYYYFTDATDNNTIKIRMGFKIPYPVFDFSVTPVNSDSPLEINKVNTNDNNKFYHNWNIKIPIARKGDSIRNLRIITVNTAADNANVNYEFYAPGSINQQNDKKLADVDTHNTILVCDIVKYNSSNEEEAIITYYISDFNIIKNINITPQGYLVFTLPNGEQITSETSILPSIDSMNLNEYGQFSINWNNTDGTSGESVSNNEIQWINDIEYTDEGFKFIYNTMARNDDGEIVYENGQPKRASKIVPIGKQQKIVTDIKFFDDTNRSLANGPVAPNDLYFTYVGIKDDLKNLGISTSYSEDSNPQEGYLTNSDGVVYKRVLGFKDFVTNTINNSVENQISQLQTQVDELIYKLKTLNIITDSDSNISSNSNISEGLSSKNLLVQSILTIYPVTSLDKRTTLRIPIQGALRNYFLKNFHPEEIGIMNARVKLEYEHKSTFSQIKRPFNRIFLPALEADVLNQIYPNDLFDNIEVSSKLNKWQNISCESKYLDPTFSNNYGDHFNQQYSFIRGFGGLTVNQDLLDSEYHKGEQNVCPSHLTDTTITPESEGQRRVTARYLVQSGQYRNFHQNIDAASKCAHLNLIGQRSYFTNSMVASSYPKDITVLKKDGTQAYLTDRQTNGILAGANTGDKIFSNVGDRCGTLFTVSSDKKHEAPLLFGEDLYTDNLLLCLTGKDFLIPEDSDSKFQPDTDVGRKICALYYWDLNWENAPQYLECTKSQDSIPRSGLHWDKAKPINVNVMVELNIDDLCQK